MQGRLDNLERFLDIQGQGGSPVGRHLQHPEMCGVISRAYCVVVVLGVPVPFVTEAAS